MERIIKKALIVMRFYVIFGLLNYSLAYMLISLKHSQGVETSVGLAAFFYFEWLILSPIVTLMTVFMRLLNVNRYMLNTIGNVVISSFMISVIYYVLYIKIANMFLQPILAALIWGVAQNIYLKYYRS